MEYEKIYPKSSIKHHVQFFWNFKGDFAQTSMFHHSSVSSIYTRLACQYISGLKIIEKGNYNELFASGFQSQTNTFYQLSSNHKVGIFGICFQPYAISLLFNIPAYEVTSHNIEITELLAKGRTFLEEQILNCRSTQERI